MLLFFLLSFCTVRASSENVLLNEFNLGEPNLERIIRDIDDVKNGVNIDYRYNDTSANLHGGGLPSASGCPKNEKGYPWVYYPQSASVKMDESKCYLAGEQGPCEPGRVIFVERNSLFGYCNCPCFEGDGRKEKGREMFCKNDSKSFKHVFYPRDEKCYRLYEQGPCEDGEWMVEMDENERSWFSLTKCEKRKCPKDREPIFAQSGLGKGKLILECEAHLSSPEQSYSGAQPVSRNECPEDYIYSQLLKKCIRSNFSFKFL